MKIASYKATRPGFAGLFNVAVRWWRSGAYSHNELVFSDGMCGSFSWLDKGVRLKRIDLKPEHWDLVDVPAHFDETKARVWFETRIASPRRSDRRYNLLLLVSFVLPFTARWSQRFGNVCSTGIAESLGLVEPWRFDPPLLHNLYATPACCQSN